MKRFRTNGYDMFWLFGARRLRQLGILGMNRRNAACILDHNPRHLFPVVDDKLRIRQLCRRIGVPAPRIYGVLSAHWMLRDLPSRLDDCNDFVLKPNRGSAGRGVLVLVGRDGDSFIRHNGERWRSEDIRHHIADILSGMYTIGNTPDQAILQQRIRLHPAFGALAYHGIP
ncbi:MAG: sugar-transfer associated ATP-grasp domain-containing protein, partial [Mariprofundaceae bacterium]|nr:sugar-transfer associated ATP-grasp domain-containing protein [Mariprofundaceae bacterium]